MGLCGVPAGHAVELVYRGHQATSLARASAWGHPIYSSPRRGQQDGIGKGSTPLKHVIWFTHIQIIFGKGSTARKAFGKGSTPQEWYYFGKGSTPLVFGKGPTPQVLVKGRPAHATRMVFGKG